MYALRNFHFLPVKNSSAILYSAGGAAIVTEPGMVMLISLLKAYSGNFISDEDLEALMIKCKVEKSDGLQYLLSHINLLFHYKENPTDFKEVTLVGDSHDVINTLFEVLKEQLNLPISISTYEKVHSQESNLFLYFSENYTPQQIKLIYSNHCNVKGTAFLTSYILHDSFFIDSLFIPSMGTPCHFCFINKWVFSEISQSSNSPDSWFNFYNYAMNEEKNIPTSLPIDTLDKGFISFLLKNHLKRILGYSEVKQDNHQLSYYTHANLIAGNLKKDVVPHWQGCGCITGSW